MTSSLLDILVVDAGAIIKGHGLGFHRVAKEDGFYTVEEVLHEIRDSKSRELLTSLPFELHVRQPPESAMRAVASFAKKSGDFASLSLTDLKLLALTYAFEVELTGGDHIRYEPAQHLGTQQPKLKPEKSSQSEGAAAGNFDDCQPCPCDHEAGQSLECDRDPTAPPVVVDDHEAHHHQEDKLPCDDVLAGEIHGDGGNSSDSSDAEESVDEEGPEDDDHDLPPDGIDNDNEGSPDSQSGDLQVAQAEGNVDSLVSQAEVNQLSPDDFPLLSSLQLDSQQSDSNIAIGEKPSHSTKSWASMLAETRDQPMRPMARVPRDERVISKGAPSSAEDFFSSASPAKFLDIHDARESRILSSRGNSGFNATQRSIEEDDGVGWINASNINSYRAEGGDIFNVRPKQKSKSKIIEDIGVHVACVTTDFSMQNVLLQMNLKVMSVDGMIIRQVKKWILRCSACYRIHSDLNRLFCSKCGANHLHRIACSIDSSTGQLKLHLKKNYQVSTRGKIYPLPRPGQQGKYEGELLLREDQLLSGIWKQKVVKINRDIRSAFGPDVVSDLGLQLNKGAKIKVGLGRANPNADKGRSRRGSKKSR